METQSDQLPPPPGLVASMIRGFDTVANHILIILPPVLLDLFLWLGPHLRLKGFFQPLIDRFPSTLSGLPTNFSNAPTVQQVATSMTNWVNQFNLFILLRTFPIGSTSLLSFGSPVTKTPWGEAIKLDAGSLLGILGWMFLLVLAGWLFGSFYYYSVSNVVVKPPEGFFWKSVKQTLLLSVIWIGVLCVFGLPILMFVSVVGLISQFLGQVMLFLVALLLIWLLMPIFFSAHGIFISQMDAMRAIMNSLRMVRFTLPNTALFLLVFVIINLGLNSLWSSSPASSWLLLVGIAGHAFVSTALLAASFIYYRDINAWLAVIFEQLQRQARSAKI